MPNNNLAKMVKRIRALAGAGDTAGATDQDLLRRYITAHDEAAFSCLVERHGAMVLGVCRKMVRHEQDAEDAFQATFLVLARKARTIRQQESVGGWLYSVAFRVANKLRAAQARRKGREGPLPGDAPERVSEDLSWREVQQVLYAELDRLADKYRGPLLLCYVQGKTRDEAAQQLGCELSVLRGRLERGRDLLRARLVRRGLSLSATLLAVEMAETASAACVVPASVFSSTVQAAMCAAEATVAAGGASAQVAALTQGVLRAMFLSKLKSVALGFLTLAVVGTGVGLVSFDTSAQEAVPIAAGARKAAQSAKKANDDLDPRKLKEENERLRRELEQTRAELLAALRENVRLKVVAEQQRDLAQQQAELARKSAVEALREIAKNRDATAQQVELAARRDAENSLLEAERKRQAVADQLAKAKSQQTREAASVRPALAITPDGKILALAEGMGVLLVDVKTSRKLALSLGHGDAVTSLAFSPDGKVLASGGKDKTVVIWDAKTLKEIRRTDTPRPVTEIRFSQDGKCLIVLEMNGSRIEVDVGSGKLIDEKTKGPTGAK